MFGSEVCAGCGTRAEAENGASVADVVEGGRGACDDGGQANVNVVDEDAEAYPGRACRDGPEEDVRVEHFSHVFPGAQGREMVEHPHCVIGGVVGTHGGVENFVDGRKGLIDVQVYAHVSSLTLKFNVRSFRGVDSRVDSCVGLRCRGG